MSVSEVHTRLEAALRELKRAERNAVLLFAEILRRKLYRDLGYATIQLYAAGALGFTPAKTSQFVRLAGALEDLPALRRSVAAGELGWTKAREVAKVATPASEARWIEEAGRSSSRELERRVRAARKRSRRTCEPPTLLNAPAEPIPEDAPVTVSVTFTAEQFARYEALLESIRKRGDRELRGAGRAEVLLAALHDLAAGEAAEAPAAPPYQVVVYTCKECGRSQTPTGHGARPAPAAVACDARIHETDRPNRATIPPTARREAMTRAGHTCQTPGCGRTRFLEVHHVKPRAAGGGNEPGNLRVLCAACHTLAHRGDPWVKARAAPPPAR